MFLRLAFTASALLLAACSSQPPLEQMTYSQTKELADQLHKRCAEQGAPMGSKEFDACMKQEVSREASTRREARDKENRQSSCIVANKVLLCQ